MLVSDFDGELFSFTAQSLTHDAEVIADATLGHSDAVKGSYPFRISAADIMVFNIYVSSFGLQYVSSNFS